MKEKIFFDSNIFIYAADKKSLFHDESVEIIKDSIEIGFLRPIYVSLNFIRSLQMVEKFLGLYYRKRRFHIFRNYGILQKLMSSKQIYLAPMKKKNIKTTLLDTM